MPDHEPDFGRMEAALKRSVAALRDAGVPFLLGGSLACWARGGPETYHDLDLMIRPQDAERALDALVAAGLRAERPPEEWLLKAWDGEILVDLIFEPSGMVVDDEAFERAEELDVLSMRMPVMALEDVVTTKLFAMSEHAIRFEGLLQIARALREQIDWDDVRRRTEGSPFAAAFFVLLDGLGIVPAGSTAATEG